MSRALVLFAALLLLVALASAQEINIAIGLGGRPAPKTIFEEIDDARERQAFRELWNAAPRAQIDTPAPASAKPSAMERPIPRLAPQTMTRLPVKSSFMAFPRSAVPPMLGRQC